MASPTKYPAPREGGDLLLRLREDYEQAVLDLFDADQEAKEVRPVLDVVGQTSKFLNNMRLPIHRWFRYSAGFSAEWVKCLLAERDGSELRVLDPFVGSGTTCLACDEMGVASYGIEAHPFVHRVAQAKLSYATDPQRFINMAERVHAPRNYSSDDCAFLALVPGRAGGRLAGIPRPGRELDRSAGQSLTPLGTREKYPLAGGRSG